MPKLVSFLIAFAAFLFVFAMVVLAHELGHFFAARRAGIRVYEFAIGFGPKLFSIKKKDTFYSLNAIPFGGYVRIAGIEGREGEDASCPENEKYYSKPPAQKFQSIVAGPLMNILLAFILFSIYFLLVGAPVGPSREIGFIVPGSEAERIGLKVGDRIEAIGDRDIKNMTLAIKEIHKSAGKELTLKINREGQMLYVKATPRFDPKNNIALIGFSPKPMIAKIGPLKSVVHGAKYTLGMMIIITYSIWLLISGQVSFSNLMGPLGIAQITGQEAQAGFLPLLYLIALISVHLAVFNLLPIPALDGGRLVFVVIEWVRRKAIPIEKENKVHLVGLLLLIALLIAVTINDFIRILQGA